jgi:hypothetical protein
MSYYFLALSYFAILHNDRYYRHSGIFGRKHRKNPKYG